MMKIDRKRNRKIDEEREWANWARITSPSSTYFRFSSWNGCGLIKSVSSTSFFTLPLMISHPNFWITTTGFDRSQTPALPSLVLENDFFFRYKIVFVSVIRLEKAAKRLLNCPNNVVLARSSPFFLPRGFHVDCWILLASFVSVPAQFAGFRMMVLIFLLLLFFFDILISRISLFN